MDKQHGVLGSVVGAEEQEYTPEPVGGPAGTMGEEERGGGGNCPGGLRIGGLGSGVGTGRLAGGGRLLGGGGADMGGGVRGGVPCVGVGTAAGGLCDEPG
jgi:hypothetical protein